tara:strand:+ start:76 stop:795 length:720 start_codon:yes stop_codon:yes gene_type:complete
MPDLQIRLIDVPALISLTEMQVDDLVQGMETQRLRNSRPQIHGGMERRFAIDLEGDFLEWMDEWRRYLGEGSLMDEIREAHNRKMMSAEEACRVISTLTEWASIGDWAAWEGRVLLYIEPHLDDPLEDAEDLYRSHVWNTALERIGLMNQESYLESVSLDWMQRREALGETMDPSKDPLILPTMQAHQRAADGLSKIAHVVKRRMDTHALIGREWLEANRWGQGEWNLQKILINGWPED